MRMTRVLAAAALAVASLSSFAPASAAPCEYPDHCYECVMYPCYPEDWPPFLLGKVTDLLPG